MLLEHPFFLQSANHQSGISSVASDGAPDRCFLGNGTADNFFYKKTSANEFPITIRPDKDNVTSS
jgi:hypothetical protein